MWTQQLTHGQVWLSSTPRGHAHSTKRTRERDIRGTNVFDNEHVMVESAGEGGGGREVIKNSCGNSIKNKFTLADLQDGDYLERSIYI